MKGTVFSPHRPLCGKIYTVMSQLYAMILKPGCYRKPGREAKLHWMLSHIPQERSTYSPSYFFRVFQKPLAWHQLPIRLCPRRRPRGHHLCHGLPLQQCMNQQTSTAAKVRPLDATWNFPVFLDLGLLTIPRHKP